MQPVISLEIVVDYDESVELPFEVLNQYTVEVFDNTDTRIQSDKVYIQENKVFIKDFYKEREYPDKVKIKYITKDFWC